MALLGGLGRAAGVLRRDGPGGMADRLRLRAAFRAQGPWDLRLQGGDFHFAHRGELFAYVETFVRHVYDAVPGFTPGDGWTVVDVGANVGCFSAYALCRMRRGALYALEPNPAAFASLERVTGAWRARRPHLHLVVRRGAAGTTRSRAEFVVPAGASVRGAFAHLAADASEGQRFEVEVLPLDAWLAEAGAATVDLLKIDVEGAEVDVLAGAPATLAQTARVVLEWHGPDRLEAVSEALARTGLRLVHRVADPADPQVGVAYFRR
jgi:FkbM family methyltransferase